MPFSNFDFKLPHPLQHRAESQTKKPKQTKNKTKRTKPNNKKTQATEKGKSKKCNQPTNQTNKIYIPSLVLKKIDVKPDLGERCLLMS